MTSYLFLLTSRDGSEMFSLREIPPKYRQEAAKLAPGNSMNVPAGKLYSMDAGVEIPSGDKAALKELR